MKTGVATSYQDFDKLIFGGMNIMKTCSQFQTLLVKSLDPQNAKIACIRQLSCSVLSQTGLKVIDPWAYSGNKPDAKTDEWPSYQLTSPQNW